MAKKDISFASFNLYNLQLPGEKWRSAPYTPAAYRKKLQWSAELLARTTPDVIAFQELWSKQCLVDLFDEANLTNDYQLIFIGDTWYDIAVAAAVRKPYRATKKVVHKAFPKETVLKKRRKKKNADGAYVDREDDEVEVKVDRFSRSVLQFDVKHTEETKLPNVRVYCAHLKSKLATRLDSEETKKSTVKLHSRALGEAISTIRRTAEAAALRILLTKTTKNNDQATVCLGDLNDGLESNTLNILTAQPSMRQKAKSRRGSSSDAGFYSAMRLQQLHSFRDVYYSHDHHGILETLDHVLVSEQFYDHSKKRVWSLSRLELLNDHVGDTRKETTDHGVIVARFDYNKAK